MIIAGIGARIQIDLSAAVLEERLRPWLEEAWTDSDRGHNDHRSGRLVRSILSI